MSSSGSSSGSSNPPSLSSEGDAVEMSSHNYATSDFNFGIVANKNKIFNKKALDSDDDVESVKSGSSKSSKSSKSSRSSRKSKKSFKSLKSESLHSEVSIESNESNESNESGKSDNESEDSFEELPIKSPIKADFRPNNSTFMDKNEARFSSLSFEPNFDNVVHKPTSNFPLLDINPHKEHERKIELLYELDDFKRQGYCFKKKYDLSTNVKELEFEVRRIKDKKLTEKKKKRKKKSVEFQSQMLLMIITGLELFSEKKKILPLRLDGFSNKVQMDIEDGKYVDIFEDLHEKYQPVEASESSPEMKLLTTLLTSAVMYHLSQSLADTFGGGSKKKSSPPPAPKPIKAKRKMRPPSGYDMYAKEIDKKFN